MSQPLLLAIPMFVFLGLLIDVSGFAKAIIAFLAALIGFVRGALYYVLLVAMLSGHRGRAVVFHRIVEVGRSSMALLGSAALAMWWDMAPDLRKEFEDWHTHEHFPERLGIPGFLRSSGPTPTKTKGVFVLYELAAFSVLSSAPYLARLNAPTPWWTALMPHHRRMVRAQSHVEASCGGVMARYATTLRFSIGAGSARALMEAVLPQLQAMREEAGAVGAHVLRHETPSIERTAEQKIRGVADTPGARVLIACGYDRAETERMVHRISTDATFRDLATHDGERNTYSLSYSALPNDVI